MTDRRGLPAAVAWMRACTLSSPARARQLCSFAGLLLFACAAIIFVRSQVAGPALLAWDHPEPDTLESFWFRARESEAALQSALRENADLRARLRVAERDGASHAPDCAPDCAPSSPPARPTRESSGGTLLPKRTLRLRPRPGPAAQNPPGGSLPGRGLPIPGGATPAETLVLREARVDASVSKIPATAAGPTAPRPWGSGAAVAAKQRWSRRDCWKWVYGHEARLIRRGRSSHSRLLSTRMFRDAPCNTERTEAY